MTLRDFLYLNLQYQNLIDICVYIDGTHDVNSVPHIPGMYVDKKILFWEIGSAEEAKEILSKKYKHISLMNLTGSTKYVIHVSLGEREDR